MITIIIIAILYGILELFKNDDLKFGNALLSIIQFILICITIISILNDFKIII